MNQNGTQNLTDDAQVDINGLILPEGGRILLGLIYLIPTIIFLILYIGVAYVIATNKKIGSPSYYSIVVQITVADILQLIFVGLATSMFVLWPRTSEIYWLNKVCGAIADCMWLLTGASANLLAFNRFVHVMWRSKVDTIFSIERTRLYIRLLYIYSVCWFIVLCTPKISFYYYTEIFSYSYCDTEECYITSQIDMSADSVNVICMTIWYAFIYLKIRKELRAIQNTIQVHGERNQDVKILLQAFLLCAMLGAVFIVYFFFPFFITSQWISVVDNILWISLAGLNTIIYLTLNSIIRQAVLELFGLKKKEEITSSVGPALNLTTTRQKQFANTHQSQTTTGLAEVQN